MSRVHLLWWWLHYFRKFQYKSAVCSVHSNHSCVILIASTPPLGVLYSLHLNVNQRKRNWSSLRSVHKSWLKGSTWTDGQSDTIMQGRSWLSAVDCISTISETCLWKPGSFMQNCTFSLRQMLPIRKSSLSLRPFDFIEIISIIWMGRWGVRLWL